MKWVFNMVGTSINSTWNTTNDSRYISNQLDRHASIIEDNTRDLHKLMAKVDYLKEDVQKLTKMGKGIHCNETPEDHYMEDPFVGNPSLGQEAKKWQAFLSRYCLAIFVFCWNLFRLLCIFAYYWTISSLDNTPTREISVSGKESEYPSFLKLAYFLL